MTSHVRIYIPVFLGYKSGNTAPQLGPALPEWKAT